MFPSNLNDFIFYKTLYIYDFFNNIILEKFLRVKGIPTQDVLICRLVL